ncbi:MAG: GWxTD domain-containing protein [candidate division Zixibacteria bacterium]|nr:GWxTD domain-containing protein [candidate division Zixibacteria bacterium]
MIRRIGLPSLILLCGLYLPPANAQSDSITIWADYACFRGVMPDQTDTVSILEFYYGFTPQMPGANSSGSGAGLLDCQLELKDSAGSHLNTVNWQVSYDAVNESEQGRRLLSDIQKFTQAPGEYELDMTCQESGSGKVGRYTLTVSVPDFATVQLQLSDIQLALDVSASHEPGKFTKNSRHVVPNPTTVYGSLDPLLYFYAEVYNIPFTAADSLYQIHYRILDYKENSVRDYGSSVKTKPGQTAVLSTGLNIASLPMGEYMLEVAVTDLSTHQTAVRRKTFFIYRVEATAALDKKSLTDTVAEPSTETRAEELRNIISFLATPDELRIYDQLTLPGKRAFLEQFWADHDPDPSTPINEYKQEIYRRFIIASEKFGSPMAPLKDRWKTDRGRVFVIYGPPDDIIRHTYKPDQPAWEKWIYLNIQGGVLFIFEDQQGFGNYKLVHSDAKGEKYSPWWANYLHDEVFLPEDVE